MARNDIRRPESPQLVVVASLVAQLFRWRSVSVILVALVYYFSTLAMLINRQNLDLANRPNSYAQKRTYQEAIISHSECTFCEGEKGIPNLDLVVPKTGGQTCRSIKSMTASEMKGSAKCATLQKEERVCCPRSYSPTKTIFVISLQGTPGAHESNQGRLDLFKEKWRMACGSSSDSTNIEHCPAVVDKRRGYGVTQAWILCLWRARQLDEEVAIFLEDDARLFQNSTQEFCNVNQRGELLSKLPSDTFIAWLGGHTWSYEDSAVPYRRVRNSYGAYGFVVPRKSIDDFYAALQHGLIHGSKDRKQNVHHNSLDPEPNFYRAAREHNKRIYAVNPLVIWHEGGYSNTWGKVRGNITGFETGRHGIKVGSGMTNTKDRKKSVSAGHQRAFQQVDLNRLQPPPSSALSGGATTKCTFCEGESESVIPKLDLVVPKTGGQSCRSIKLMTATEIEGSVICSTLQKEEKVCCPASAGVTNRQNMTVPFKKGDWLLNPEDMVAHHESIRTSLANTNERKRPLDLDNPKQLSRSPTAVTSFDSWEKDHCWRKRELGNRAAYDLLITGAGYSSTGFFAQTFTKAGYPVGHEKFGKNSVGISDWLMSSRRNHHSPYKFNHIFLLVRHPLKVLHSAYGTRWNFTYTSKSGITSDVANDESLLGPEEFGKLAFEFKALEWWLMYTLLGENIAECYIRNEDISGELFLNICSRAELPNCTTKDWASIVNPGKKYNSHNSRTDDQVTWEDLESMAKTESENTVLQHARQVCLKFYSSKDC